MTDFDADDLFAGMAPERRKAIEDFAAAASEPLAITLNPAELIGLIDALRLASDAVLHINETGESLQGRPALPDGTTWAGPERWGRDPYGALDSELMAWTDIYDRLTEIDKRNAVKRRKIYDRLRALDEEE